MKKILAILATFFVSLFIHAQAQNMAYVYLQGTWVSQAGDPSVTITINSPNVEIGHVLANANYSGSTTCSTDLVRTGENDLTINLQETVISGGCAGGSATLRHDQATDTLYFQAGAVSAQLQRYSANTDVASRGAQTMTATSTTQYGLGPDGTVCECAPRPLEAFLTTYPATTTQTEVQATTTTVSPAQQLLEQAPVTTEAAPMPVQEAAPKPPTSEK